jgi:transposase-like protein
MPLNKAEVKTRLLKAYEAQLDKQLADLKEELSLAEIEEVALALRGQVSEDITQVLVNQQSRHVSPDEYCPTCGSRMRNKGRKRRGVLTRSGEAEVERPYYYCETCQTGHFPPG